MLFNVLVIVGIGLVVATVLHHHRAQRRFKRQLDAALGQIPLRGSRINIDITRGEMRVQHSGIPHVLQVHPRGLVRTGGVITGDQQLDRDLVVEGAADWIAAKLDADLRRELTNFFTRHEAVLRDGLLVVQVLGPVGRNDLKWLLEIARRAAALAERVGAPIAVEESLSKIATSDPVGPVRHRATLRLLARRTVVPGTAVVELIRARAVPLRHRALALVQLAAASSLSGLATFVGDSGIAELLKADGSIDAAEEAVEALDRNSPGAGELSLVGGEDGGEVSLTEAEGVLSETGG